MQVPFTNLSRQYTEIKDDLVAVTDEILSSGNLMNGTYTDTFEKAMIDATGDLFQGAVTCHSGTSALEMMYEYFHALYIEMHSCEAIMILPCITFPATINAALRAGWKIVLGDVFADGTLNIESVDFDQFNGPVAVTLVGLYGNTHSFFNESWQVLNRLYLDNKIAYILEDAAQHVFGRHHPACDAAAVSFDPTKNLANHGNGGMVLCRSINMAYTLKEHRAHGNYEAGTMIGTNSRMSEIDCAMLCLKLKHIPVKQHQRADIARHWINEFTDRYIRTITTKDNIQCHAHQKFALLVENRNEVQAYLKDKGIITKVHYHAPLYEMDAYHNIRGCNLLSVGSFFSRRTLSLPFYPELTDNEIEYITATVIDAIKYTS